MFFKFKDKKIHYKTIGKKGEWIVFLHGWGGSVDSFLAVAKCFKNNRCLLLDFPPFGKSEQIDDVWELEDYVCLLKELLDFLKIDNIKLIAHSFGGRVAILFASIYNNVSKMILTDSAGIRPKKKLIVWFKIKKYKLLKKLGFKQKNKGSKDYQALSDNMKKTFVKIVNRHLEKECLKISCPTLIIFGEKDKTTPIYMAKKLNSLIKDSEVIIFKNAGHFAYLDKFNDFVIISNKFME